MLRTGVRVPPDRVGAGKPPAGLGYGMLSFSGEVTLGKIYLSSNYNDCHNVEVDFCCVSVSQGNTVDLCIFVSLKYLFS